MYHFDCLTRYSTDTHFDASTKLAFENIVGKRKKIARNEQFLLFPQCFLLNQIFVSLLVYIFDIISLFAAKMKEPRIGISGKGLNPYLSFCIQRQRPLFSAKIPCRKSSFYKKGFVKVFCCVG